MNNSVMMNWSNLNKSILVLILGGLAHILWIMWFLYSSLTPSLQHWMNPDYFITHITCLVISCILHFVFIYPCVHFQHIKLIQTYYPYFVIIFFSTTFMYAGYAVGIMSPATIASYISLVSVGLVLFERKLIYSIFVPITLYLLSSIVLSEASYMSYAPLFSDALNNSDLMHNTFWVYSQLYLYIPIFFASIFLFEVLLTQWRNREKQINTISQMDPLTGIYNRRKIGEDLALLEQDEQNYALVLLDLDFFKSINDNYGHDIGDLVLKGVAKLLSKKMKDQDVIGRFGGEEFILLLKNKSLRQALDLAEICRKEIEKEQYIIDKKKYIRVTGSFGVAVSNVNLSKETVIRHADQALYMAKKSGRNQVRHYFEIQNAVIHKEEKYS